MAGETNVILKCHHISTQSGTSVPHITQLIKSIMQWLQIHKACVNDKQPQDEWAPRLWPGEEPLPPKITIKMQHKSFFVSMLNKPLEDVACYCPCWFIVGPTLLDSAIGLPWE